MARKTMGGCIVVFFNTLTSINEVALHWARLLLVCWQANHLSMYRYPITFVNSVFHHSGVG